MKVLLSETANGCRSQWGYVDFYDLPALYKINCGGDARRDWPRGRPVIRREDDESDLTVREVLLIPDILAAMEQQVKPTLLCCV